MSPEVLSGNQISLSCTAEGTISDIAWSREGVTLGENSHVTINVTQNNSNIFTSQLVIADTGQADAGTYSCTASGEAGTDVRSFVLAVNGKWIKSFTSYWGKLY